MGYRGIFFYSSGHMIETLAECWRSTQWCVRMNRVNEIGPYLPQVGLNKQSMYYEIDKYLEVEHLA